MVTISFLKAEVERDGNQEAYLLRELRSGGEAGFDEKKLLQGFFGYFERLKPRLVSFNGRGFDLPVLKYRAMVHGVSVSWLYGAGDKWNSYQNRYSTDWHCDLLDVLSDYGTSARVSCTRSPPCWACRASSGLPARKSPGWWTKAGSRTSAITARPTC